MPRIGANRSLYEHKVRVPKWNVPVSPLTADYTTAGRLLKQEWAASGRPLRSKQEWLDTGDAFVKTAARTQKDYRATLQSAYKALKATGTEPGPLISGIGSDRFPDETKKRLRDSVAGVNYFSSAALAAYSAAGIRAPTARKRVATL